MIYHKIVVGIIEYKNNLLFIKRSKKPFKNTLVLPGGKVEKNETIETALKRII